MTSSPAVSCSTRGKPPHMPATEVLLSETTETQTAPLCWAGDRDTARTHITVAQGCRTRHHAATEYGWAGCPCTPSLA